MYLGKVRWYVEEQMKDLPRLVHEKTDEGLHLGLCYFEWNNIHHQFLYNLDYKHFRENNSEMDSATIVAVSIRSECRHRQKLKRS